jgi:hypothetical protein
MHVKLQFGCLAERSNYRHAYRDIGDKMAIHHIDVQQRDSAAFHGTYGITQTGKVRG